MKKEIIILMIISSLLVYHLIGDAYSKYWTCFYFFNNFSLIILLCKYRYENNITNFIILFFAIQLIRLFTKYIVGLNAEIIYKVLFFLIYVRFFALNLLKNEIKRY